MEDSVTDTVDELLMGLSLEMTKGDAIVAYALALEAIQELMFAPANYPDILVIIDDTRSHVQTASLAFGGDTELDEIDALLLLYRDKFD
jgi:hypothetical protein